MGDDVVEELQVVVAGNAEDLGDAEFGEAVQQIVTDGVGGFGPDAVSSRGRRYASAVETALRATPPRYGPAMAINESREIVIEASPEEILDVIADFDAVHRVVAAASERRDPGDETRTGGPPK